MNSYRNKSMGTRACVEDARQLDVRVFGRHGLLKEGQEFGWTWRSRGKSVAMIDLRAGAGEVLMVYGQNGQAGQWQDSIRAVALDYTPCHLGGQRVWWLCPEPGCGRRVAVLYGESVVACRHCHNMAHRSQSETAGDRAARQANKIRRRLGWAVGVLNAPGGKPKGMHWKTFALLRAAHDRHAQQVFGCLAESLGLTGEAQAGHSR